MPPRNPVRKLVWSTVAVFAVAMVSLWLLQELVDPTADFAQASIAVSAPPAPASVDAPPVLSVGRYIGPDGRIAAEMLADTFLAGEAIHAAMAARHFAPGTAAQASWYGPGEKLLYREEIVVRPRQLRVGFVLSPAHTAYRGTYRVEVLHGPDEVASRTFAVH